MKPWRWDPHALTQLTGDRAVRILPPAEPVAAPYDWQNDPELSTLERPNPLGFTVRSSELGNDWTPRHHLERLAGAFKDFQESLTPPDARDWQEEQDARLLESAGDLSWDEAHDATVYDETEDWVPPPEEE